MNYANNHSNNDRGSGRKDRFFVLVICAILCAVSCISPFEPDIPGVDNVMVVDGSFIKGQEKQVIKISKSASIADPVFIPVENCSVKVVDNSGNEFLFSEESPGNYVAFIDDASIQYGREYKLVFNTLSGKRYESEYQLLVETEPVDSIYGIKETHYAPDVFEKYVDGMQFYIDLGVSENASSYYRWLVEETYEIQSYDEIWGVYTGQDIKLLQNKDSLMHCWRTDQVTGLYSASTVGLSKNNIVKIPVHFRESTDMMFIIRYCLTVKQYALNEDAYRYWDQKKAELYESGGIYSLQPGLPKSNIFNIDNPGEMVLGFFWASSCTIKRIFLKNPFHQLHDYNLSCRYFTVASDESDFNYLRNFLYDMLGLYGYTFPAPPIYITHKQNLYTFVLNSQCVDCMKIKGGTRDKPDFW